MPFAPSFGSVGDFIAISILIKDVINALDDAQGSSAEYRQIIMEMLSLEKSFLQVGIMCQTPDPLPKLVVIYIQVRRITDQCKECIQKLLDRLYKYTLSLREGGSGDRIRDGINKIKFKFEKDKIMTFHQEILTHSVALTTLLNVAQL